MAITNNLWLRGAKQKLGGVVLYQAQGETRMRELAASVANPRTERQMAQRVRWANLVNFYRANSTWMQRAYENKPQNNTDYNRFMSLNGGSSTIYLTKSEANAGACVVAPYRVTDGTLSAIEITASGQNWNTNIFLGNLASIGAATTVGQFAQAILSSNAGVQAGDQLSFIRMSQQVNSATGYPFVLVRKYEVLMNPNSSELLSDYLPLDYFAVATASGNKVLQVVNSGNAGGFVLVLSRTEGGIIRISPQDVIVANNNALITRYSSAAQQQLAAQSYGEGTEVFLSSASANEINPWGIDNSIISAYIGDASYTPNSYVGSWADMSGEDAICSFANPFTPTNISVSFSFSSGGTSVNREATSALYQDGAVIAGIPAPDTGLDTYVLTRISVTADDTTYNITFANSDEEENELG